MRRFHKIPTGDLLSGSGENSNARQKCALRDEGVCNGTLIFSMKKKRKEKYLDIKQIVILQKCLQETSVQLLARLSSIDTFSLVVSRSCVEIEQELGRIWLSNNLGSVVEAV